MPCSRRITMRTTVDMSGSSLDLLAKALKAEGYSDGAISNAYVTSLHKQVTGAEYTYFVHLTISGRVAIWQSGKLTIMSLPGDVADVNAIKRAYARQVVKKVAQARGWQVKYTSAGQKTGTVVKAY